MSAPEATAPQAPPALVPGRRRPRLVHLTTTAMSLDWLLRPQLEAFAAAGYEVVGMSAPDAHAAALEASGIPFVALEHATRATDLVSDARALAELRGAFDRLRPDVVHTHNPKPGVYGRLAARAAGVPVVVNTQHGLYATEDDPLAKRAVVYGLERLAAACSDRELVQNGEDVETLARLGVPRDRLVLLGNGVDLERFDPDAATPGTRASVRAALGLGPDDVAVGAVGRLVWEKGIREVIAAATTLRSRDPRVKVLVIGPDDDAKADAVGPEERAAAERDGGVRFLGRRDDVEAIYTALDLYVLASYREGFPRSAMEAAAMGLPIVTTDVRGCREVVEHGRNGLLVPVRDAGALADAIGELAADPERRQRYGEASRALARRRFDQRSVIATTLTAYEELLRSPEAARRAARWSASDR